MSLTFSLCIDMSMFISPQRDRRKRNRTYVAYALDSAHMHSFELLRPYLTIPKMTCSGNPHIRRESYESPRRCPASPQQMAKRHGGVTPSLLPLKTSQAKEGSAMVEASPPSSSPLPFPLVLSGSRTLDILSWSFDPSSSAPPQLLTE